MRRRIHTILSLLIFASLAGEAQNIRYVSKDGTYANDGKSWTNAKLYIQDAIDDLAENGGGEVWVAAGTYSPTSSTESTGGSSLYSAFKIPAGVSVYGGFKGDETSKDARETEDAGNGDVLYKNETILSGDLSSTAAVFSWNSTKKQYDTSFYGSCYHVVWFATNGFDDDVRANALDGTALLEGCTIKDGNAKNTSLTDRYHNAYGGGIYMVEGARVENCIILNCEASRDGGGVYMDGGGELVHCYIFECQALGIGVENGYGGGVCMESNTSATAYGIERSYISGCVGRLGGGLAIKVPTRSSGGADLTMKAYASAVAVVNNVATIEGGGVYTYQGGVMTQLTIANNQCNGSGVISNDIVTGRSAGLYCRDKATVLNSVMWGGECDANDDVQFATSRSEVSDSYKTIMKYCQLSNSGYVDWSGTAKTKVAPLSIYNSSTDGTASSSTEGYPIFKKPSSSAGYIENIKTSAKDGSIDWQPSASSCLCNAGIIAIDLDKDGEYPFAEASVDILGTEYTPHATVGAYVRVPATITPMTGDNTYEFFVDPEDNSTEASDTQGNSWNTPASHLSSVFETIKGSNTYSNAKCIVHVKEGTLSSTNPYQTGRVRTLTISVPSNVTVYGGYPTSLSGTSTETRNPILYPTIISGDIMGDYDTNVAHLVTFDGVSGVVFDGLQVRYANASTTYLANDDTNGAGMLFLNGANVTVKNCLIAGCTADQGAAIYASGSSVVSFENCIIHNNASSATSLGGIVYTEGTAALTFDHCDFLRNVGYACYLGGTGTQKYTNSVFYSNMSEAMDDTSDQGSYALPSFTGNTDNVTGDYCFFDAASADFKDTFGTDLGDYQYDLSYELNGDGYPRFINPTVNAGVSTSGDVTRYGRSVSFEPHNNNPMVNAASYSGSHDEWGTDMSTVTTRDYGGLPDIGAVENHEASTDDEGENANAGGQPAYGSVIYVRDYNTYSYVDASMSATATDEETTHSDGTTMRDGSSWANAINGNAYYTTETTTSKTATFASITGVAQAQGTSNQFKLGITSEGTTYYIYYDTSSSGFSLTIDWDEADYFVFISTATTNAYLIYDVTSSTTSSRKYLSRTSGSNYSVSASSSNNTTWTIQSGGISSTISFSSGESTLYLVIGDNNSLSISSTSGNNWSFYKATTATDHRGLQYAINLANAQYTESGTPCSIFVGGGVYGGTTGTSYSTSHSDVDEYGQLAMTITIKEGANLYGGFPRTGNPGENERNISNSDYDDDGEINYCRTFIDANSEGRVVTQEEDFNETTVVEGFIIQNGSLTGTAYGGGVYLRDGGVIKNCLIQKNAYTTTSACGTGSSNPHGGGGIYIASGGLVKNSTIKNNTATNHQIGSYYIGGAGVFSNGGTLQNSLIVENKTYNPAYNVLGAALYITDVSKLYNCTIAYNVGYQGDAANTQLGTNTVVSPYPATGGVWDGAATLNESEGKYYNASQFYNCIVWGNYATGTTVENYVQIGMSGFSKGGGATGDALHDCYSCAASETYSSDDWEDNSKVYQADSIDYSSSSYYEIFYEECQKHEPFLRDTNGDTDYSLSGTGTSLYCINMGGNEDVLEAQGITEDIFGAARVQDCTVDKGACEYNGSSSILPDTDTSDGQAVFYVTPEGYGTASGANPANAACASKLQKILDAAGRYKYLNPKTQVIVKVATYAPDDDGERDADFQYYANRTTDSNSSAPRIWSIMVPRGVEVWGGYTDAYTDSSDNGFYTKTTVDDVTTVTDLRDVLANPTYFDSYYYSTEENSGVNTYHVVTFTDKVFDIYGNPYLSTDAPEDDTWGTSNYDGTATGFLSLSTDGGVTDRAVLDGIFITNGQADAVSSSTAASLNVNSYGGAAIVTDYAHVRNCILRSNQGTYGGALALTHGALVSGCLLDQNSADYGGAIYVFEDGVTLSDGTAVSTAQGSASTYDGNMPHVYTSTIVNNSADTQGGGVWYSDDNANVRFNSTVIWQNTCSDMANISGLYSLSRSETTTASTIEYYPFNYCAVQDITIMGLNNISLGTTNAAGTRFHKEESTNDANALAEEDNNATDFTKYDDFGYYGLTNSSVLTNAGMPLTSYSTLVASSALAENDFAALARDAVGDGTRSYVDIGARAFAKSFPTGLMLRIFVAKATDVDATAMKAMIDSGDSYYSMEGSSFAYPMNNLQDALDYIVSLRTVEDGSIAYSNANNYPFEIIMGRGTYYPTQDLSGLNTSTVANTFLIPEGVTIIGGFDAETAYKAGGTATGASERVFYGAGYAANESVSETPGLLTDNITPLEYAETTVSVNDVSYTILQYKTDSLTKYREHTDINANSIIEPWEFKNQTILSGHLSNSDAERSDHVVTLIANQDYVGALPYARSTNASYAESGADNYGYTAYEMGQPVVLDGLTISGGYAYGYEENTVNDVHKLKYNQGGGLLADGNRYYDGYNKEGSTREYKHLGKASAVGYRDLHVVINKCKFVDNLAGFGGALSSNGTVDIFNSTFENNEAKSGSDLDVDYGGSTYNVSYPGAGGAIYAMSQLSAVNTIFANNEALDTNYSTSQQNFKLLNLQISGANSLDNMLGGVGGAVFVGRGGYFHFTNCDFVRNQANAFPAVYTMNPNTNSYTTATMSTYNQMINTIVWGNDVNDTMESKYSDGQNFAAHLICNYGLSNRSDDYSSSLDSDVVPTSQDELDSSYEETAWFSAYESGVGISTLNSVDLRDSVFVSSSHIVSQIKNATGGSTQNCNITLSSTNTDNSGPNFVNPSSTPGVEGYLESSDWSPSRINNLTDNGSGKISQTVESTDGTSYTSSFDTESGRYVVTGIYPLLKYADNAPYYNSYTPIGEDEYMYASYTDDDGNQVNLYRISYDPNPTHNSTYVDIGVYEYPHTPLTISTYDDVDILWVSSKEKADNGMPEGSCWSQPTSDLQRAIETLLASRNGHRKEIRLMDGTYSPIYTIDGSLSFYIDTYKLNDAVVLSDEGVGKGVQSLTIRGGYSYDTEGVYDVDEYQAILQQQTRTESESDRWNHLFYIHDATQRYGADSYESNLNGLTTDDVGSDNIKSFSIEIDGVTLINDQALEGTQGTAIYYEDVSIGTDGIQDLEATEKYTVQGTDDVTIKVLSSNGTDSVWVKIQPAKIILSKCKVVGSGTHYDGLTSYEYSSSAVYLGSGSSHALLFNNVMHSNYGDPLVAKCLTYSTNNGFALNYGLVDLNEAGSTVHNSIFWRNYGLDSSGNKCDPLSATSYGDQLELALSSDSDLDMTVQNASNTSGIGSNATYFSYNAYTGGDIENSDYQSTNGTVAGYQYNVGLSDTNDDAMNGPNFTDPENSELLDRDFSLLPSLRLLNRGNNERYVELTTTSGGSTRADATSLTLGADNVYDLAAESTSSVDAAHNPRFVSTTIDVGPYECQKVMQRIYYINPNNSYSDTATGDSWESAYGYGSLDEAMRLAYLYNVANSKEAYVFVKGFSSSNADGHLGETIVMRNGVSVYGGINPLYNTDCEANTVSSAGETKTYERENILAYLAKLKEDMYPYVGPQSYKTRISGIEVDSSVYNNSESLDSITAVVDGFYVTPYDIASATISEPAINVNPTSADSEGDVARVALSHLVVTGFTGASDVNIAEVGNSLIYEALFYGNTVSGDGSVLNIGTNGYAVNLTVEGTTTDSNNSNNTTPLNGSGSLNIFNSLVNYASDEATANTLSGYNYQLSDTDLNYQLAEQSCHIDASDIANASGKLYNDSSTFLPRNLQTFVSYTTDRDLLGNRRLLKSVSGADNVDYGAFETWRVDKSVVNSQSDGGYYPHAGSVVYIMENNSLVMEEYLVDKTSGEMEQGYTLMPGFLLVQEGASLYGQGNEVDVAYAAVERTVRNDGSIVSVPYVMNYADAAMPTYDDNTGVLTLNKGTNSYYTYNGENRSSWDYIFQTSNSGMWEESSDETAANEGVLFIPGATDAAEDAEETYYRFTAQGSSMTDYIYTESIGEASKTVELTQNDDRESTSGGADFTSSEDMGWNCIGLPYLVSQYKTYDKYVGNESLYNMQVPHTMWLYYDGTYDTNKNVVDGDGGYYSVSSWDITEDNWNLPDGSTPYVWVGEGIFVQTAAVADTEDLLFYRPVYDEDSEASGSKLMTRSTSRYYTGEKIMEEEVVPDFRISANGHVVSVIGLEGGERVVIYDSAGRMVSSETSQAETYSTSVASRGVYIVKVNGAAKKVLVR